MGWTPKRIFLIPGLLVGLGGAIGSAVQAAVDRPMEASAVGMGVEQFATEQAAKPRLDLNLVLRSESEIAPARAGQELHLVSFFESGTGGDRSFDLDRMVARWATAPGIGGFIWVGRTQPVEEGSAHPELARVEPVSAIGARWVQNQSDALSPRVSGWLGAGWRGEVDGFSVVISATPFFLPTFGPRLDLSEVDSASGSRFARLPPQFVNSQRDLVAIRYKVDTGNLKDIVLQHQVYAGIGQDTSLGEFRLMAWSAPAPDPALDLSDLIRVNAQDAEALVTVVPYFPRQDFLAFQWSTIMHGFRFSDLESAFETTSGNLTLSGSLQPFRFFRLGTLQTVATRSHPSNDAETSAAVESPPYAKDLVWLEVSGRFFRERLVPSFRLEQHLTSGRQGAWLRPGLAYLPDGHLAVFAAINVIAGQAGSYFGEWRALDSVATGVRYLW